MLRALRLHSSDNVAVALESLLQGSRVAILGAKEGMSIEARQEIPFAHKIAVRSIPQGQAILKYGAPIAYATSDIEAGHWVHTHNAGSYFARSHEAQQK